MLRRLAPLAILLFSLFGAVPAALACVLSAASTDCCAADGSCGPESSQPVLTTTDAACCDVQGTTQNAAVCVSTKTERSKALRASFDQPGAPAFTAPRLATAVRSRSSISLPVATPSPDQQQIYLLTERLRL